MELLVIVPSFLVFLYCVYKLVKDDYIFIRKGISLEQMFDIVFSITWISLVTSRFFYYLLNVKLNTHFLANFFAVQKDSFSLLGAVIGGITALYIIAKYRKIPLGRIFDFISLAFLIALPIGFASVGLMHKGLLFYIYLAEGAFYLLLTIFFMKALYPRLMSRTLKEGIVTSYIFLIFFVMSIASSIGYQLLTKASVANLQNVLLVLLFIGSCVVVFRQDKNSHKTKKI